MRVRLFLVLTVGCLAGLLAGSLPAATAQPTSPADGPSAAERAAVLAAWTQPTAASYAAWNDARAHQARWAAYAFDWSTDGCTDSPDQPLGFDFGPACQRHDFGHRNYAALGEFGANKDRIDRSFRFDLDAVCGRAAGLRGALCRPVAWTYYEAARVFGSIPPALDPTRA